MLSIITILFTLVFGRFFCGWICPLGSLNQCVSYFKKKLFRVRKYELYYRHQRIRYLLFISLVVLALLGINLVGIVDPLSFFSRGIIPVFQNIAGRIFRILQYLNIHFGIFANDKFFYWIQAYLGYFHPPYFRYAAITTFFLLLVLVVNLLVSRFWCLRVCPLGGCLGFLSAKGILNLSQPQDCQDCLECSRNCQGACDPHKRGEWKKQECLYCWNCVVSCPQGTLRFGLGKKNKAEVLDLSRRQLIYSLGALVIAAPLLKLGIKSQRLNPELIRPPGSLEEDAFLRRCIRCGQCIKVCPSNFLHPTLLEANLAGIWTPYAVGRLGFCKYDCNLCGRVCPTQAIRNLELRQKQKIRIGTACVDRNRCLPYASGIACTLCSDNCPVPGNAIKLTQVIGSDSRHRGLALQAPSVDFKRCIGCGRCENVCPVKGPAAIYCTNTAEERLQNSRLLSYEFRTT